MRRLPYWFVVVSALSTPVAHAEDWPVPRGPAREPAPFTLDAKYLAAVPKEFLEDAPACILFTRTAHLIENDGTVTTVVHEITRFNGRKGIEKLGEYHSIYFNPRHEQLTLNEARVLKADGTRVPVEPRHVQLRDTGTDFQVYDDSKQLVISWPNLQVGDAYEVKWTVRGKDPEFGGEFFSRYNFGDDELPVFRDELLVRVPAGRPLQFGAVNGPLEPTKSERDGQVTYHWQVQRKEPLPRDDDRPSKEELRLQVAVSTFPSWDAVGTWKQKGRQECWQCTPALKAIVAKVAGPEPTPAGKARALTYWVRQNIRYRSRGPEGMGYTPHAPAQVLGNRFGDCKDQAQLLAVMLREVGLRPWLVTLGTLDDGQVLDEVPSPWGSHAIVLLELDGKEHWIDTTVSQAAWDYLPRADCGRRVYLVRDGQIKLSRTPALSYDSYRIEQTTQVTVAPDGTSHNQRTVAYHGTGAWSKREAWLDTPIGERRRLIAAELQEASARSHLVALKIDERSLHDYDGPVRAEIDFETPDHFSGEGREGSLSDGVVWNRLLAYTLDPARSLPLELPAPFDSVHRFVVQLPAALRATQLPDEKKVVSPWGFLTLKVVPEPKDAHRFEIELHTRLSKTRVEPAEFAAFQRFHEEVGKAYRCWLSLRPTHELADAPALEALLAKAPADERISAEALARLYLENDRRDDARRVLALAVKHHPDAANLWEMRLQATPEPADQEALYRAMVARFPKEGRYAVALGANLGRRGEHAEAERVLVPLTRSDSASVRGAAHYQLARVYLAQAKPDAALTELTRATDCDPTILADLPTIEFKARLHERLGQVQDALATYRLGVAGADRAFDLLEPLIRLEWSAGQKADALDHLRRYTVAVGQDPRELGKVAALHLLLGRTDDALELANRIPKDKQTLAVHRVLGLAHARRREFAEAIAQLDLLGKVLGKADAEVINASVSAHLALGDLAGADRLLPLEITNVSPEREAFETCQALKMRSRQLASTLDEPQRRTAGKALDMLVCAEYGLDHGWPREQVETMVNDSLKQMKFAPTLALRGWCALERGQLSKALADAETAIGMKGADARAYLVRGRVRLERGDKNALADLEEAAKLCEVKDWRFLHWLATAQAQAGQRDAALETQRQAVELRPNDPELREQLRQLEAEQRRAEK